MVTSAGGDFTDMMEVDLMYVYKYECVPGPSANRRSVTSGVILIALLGLPVWKL